MPVPLIAAGLVLLVLLAYEPLRHAGFVGLDDPQYVTRNPHVLAGLRPASLGWAFTSGSVANWHPLAWISHMLDVELYGARPFGHHASSVLLHAANAVLLFIVLRRMTGALWRSAAVAALFALHPARVESVAWIAERKDVLCALFWLLGMLGWARYAERPSVARYGWVALAHGLALLAKPMAVTFPFALVLLDYWPLRRARPLGRLLAEKLPLFALSLGSSVVTYLVQRAGGSAEAWAVFPLPVRLAHAPVAYLRQLGKLLWPDDLGPLYPHPGMALGAGEVAVACAALAAITLATLALARRRPFALVGWLWFLGTLVPVIGIVQVGYQGFADRYTYLPSIGIWLALVWLAAEGLERAPRAAAIALCALVLGALVGMTRAQIVYWRDGVTLLERALAVTRENFAAHSMLAGELADAGRLEPAVEHYREALRIRPGFPFASYGLGVTLEEQGKTDEAIARYREALRADPRLVPAHFNLANLLGRAGELEQAVRHYRRALELEPGHRGAHQGLAVALGLLGRPEEAERHRAPEDREAE